MDTMLQVRLGSHQGVRGSIEALLSGLVPEPTLLQGLLDSVALILRDLASDPTVPRALGVEVTTSAGLVEIRIARREVVDTLVCPLG